MIRKKSDKEGRRWHTQKDEGKEPICRLCCKRSFAVTRSSSSNCNYKHNVLHGELVIFASVQDMEKWDIFTNSTIRLLRLSFQQLCTHCTVFLLQITFKNLQVILKPVYFFVVLNTQMNWVGHFIIYFLFILFSLFFFFFKRILLYYMLLLAIWLLWGAAAPLTQWSE